MSQLFAWGDQSTGVSALASFLPKKYFLHDLKKKKKKNTFSVVFIPTGPFSKVYNIKRVLAPTDTKVFCQDQFYNLKVTISSLHKEGNAKITIYLINILLQLALNTAVIN